MIGKRKITMSTTQIIMLSFLVVVFVGSLLLYLPISSVGEGSVSYIDALFTATTATCVTGLVTVTTATTWTVFGQAVILILVQIGGLGVITVMSALMILINHRMGLGQRLLVQDAFNLNTLSGLGRFVKKVMLGTFIIEGIGALLYMTVFVPEFGLRGIWIAIFNAVSAFCNAGMDIIGENSLMNYATNPIINATSSALIVLGGIGYIVWWDVIRVYGSKDSRPSFKRLTLHSKIALSSSLLLILVGGALILLFEYNNPDTLGGHSFVDKLQMALFQSVTTRTAGFAAIPQESLTDPSSIVSMFLMVIGGSPVGTAGGIKTVTFTVLIASAVATVRGKDGVTLFNRTVAKTAVEKAATVCTMFIGIALLSTLLLTVVTDAPIMDVLYETVSATATVGLSRGLTPLLNTLGKIIIIFTMYLGRVGPISLALALSGKPKQNLIKDPIEDISVG